MTSVRNEKQRSVFPYILLVVGAVTGYDYKDWPGAVVLGLVLFGFARLIEDLSE